MINLENIDKIVERTGVSYEKAKEALEKTNNDVIAAIILIENDNPRVDEQIKVKSKVIIDVIKEILNEGTATHIKIKKKNKTVVDLPVIIGAGSLILVTGSLILAPIIGVLGMGAVYLCDFEIFIEKSDGTVVDVIEFTKKKLADTKTKINKG